MTPEIIATRFTELNELRQQQMHRLEKAKQEQQFALASLERIEGARQDVEWWTEQLKMQQRPVAVENAVEVTPDANGQTEPSSTP